jgi:hypothetical protein
LRIRKEHLGTDADRRRDTATRAPTTTSDARADRTSMFRDLASKLYSARGPASTTTRRDDADASRRRAASAPRGSTADAADDASRAPSTFADRWMMSWTDEDVTFLGEDPYGDCAGNVFAAAAAEARRRRASVDETREPRASGDEDAASRRASMDDARGATASAEAKARAFWRIGPT